MTARVVLLTGGDRRHRYVARELHHSIGLAGIVGEEKADPVPAGPLPPGDLDVLRHHLAEREQTEEQLLGQPDLPGGVPHLAVSHGGINDPDVLEWVGAAAPDLIVLYGTSLVRAPLLDTFAGRIVNLHLGLSPYYRGTATNFWALVHREPECVGATLHLAAPRVDAGGILEQVRPACLRGDRAHELGTRALMAATAVLPAVLERYAAGRLEPVPQDLSHGLVFRRRDFTAAAVRCLWRQLETGMIDEFLATRDERLARRPIVQRVAANAPDQTHVERG